MKNFKLKGNRNKKGFTLLVAMIVTALILAIGFSIGNIILKELALSASGRRSQVAFYAADSIAECALYWDKKDAKGISVDNSDVLAVRDSPFATSTTADATLVFIQCGTGIPGNPEPGSIGGFTKTFDELNATSSFVAIFNDPQDVNAVTCGEVTIAKNLNKTVIEARGYNVGYTPGDATQPAGCDISNPKTVERGIKVDY